MAGAFGMEGTGATSSGRRRAGGILVVCVVGAWIALAGRAAAGEEVPEGPGGAPVFWSPAGLTVEKEIRVAGSPQHAFDAFTGDVSPWWDHHLASAPVELVIDAKPGGTFHEIFDDSGDGAIHADVIRAKRGEILVLRGPFGFTGHALDLVHTFTFTADGDSTRVKLVIHGAGQLQDGWADALSGVWDHFLGRYAEWANTGRAPAE